MTKLDVLIIGAGQAGLALGYHLQKTRLRFQLVERNEHIGDTWRRRRYDSLVLFTPRAYSSLPGLPFVGDPDGYPSKDEFAEYLETYARHLNLPAITGTGIQSLERLGDGYCATTDDGAVIEARSVVLATGAFQSPVIPPIGNQLSAEVLQITAGEYRNARQIPAEAVVLVVGDGAAGRDIALELADGHKVLLAAGHTRKLFPQRVLGKSIWWWLDIFGIMRLSAETALGRRMRKAEPFTDKGNTLKDLKDQGVQVLPKLVAAQGQSVTFADGTLAKVTAIVWATGYRDSSAWVAIPEVKDAQGNFVQEQGIAPIPNFYFIGRPWQRSRGSALIMGVGEDAAWITAHIVADLAEVQQLEGMAPRSQPAPLRETGATT
ncbi:MAG: NAD(P)/FAD-dependent oxidoreductase [Chloroflexota bacterium]